MSARRASSIRLFLADGTPDGLVVVEKSNWTGKAVVAGRFDLKRALERQEMEQPGVYVLTGYGDGSERRAYVGQADALGERLREHAKHKDFWGRLIAFTSTNEGLNKAHARHLEARLIKLAKRVGEWTVDNVQSPSPPPMSEADRADAEWFLGEMLVIFPLLGVDAFKEIEDQTERSSELVLNQRGAHATGREVADGFVVLKGSRARADEIPSITERTREARETLKSRGVLESHRESEAEYLRFTQDHRFKTPSAAASVLVGGNANGLALWKDEEDRDLKTVRAMSAEPDRAGT